VATSRRTGDREDRDPDPRRLRPQAPVNAVVPVDAPPKILPPAVLRPETVLALQRSAGNRAVRELLGVQRGRAENAANARKKLLKERKRRKWKKDRLWPEHQLKGRILEVTDKYLFRVRGGGYVDMNKVVSNFPAIDGIANGKFRQVKAYLHLGANTKKARGVTVARVVAEVEKLSEKCEIAARRLTSNNGLLLRQILAIDAGRASTKGRIGKAPYAEADTSAAARKKHKGVLPASFTAFAGTQITSFDAKPAEFDFDTDGLATKMMSDMVVVVPDDLVADVRSAVGGQVTVEGGGLRSTEIKSLMDAEGYAVSKRGEDDDGDYAG